MQHVAFVLPRYSLYRGSLSVWVLLCGCAIMHSTLAAVLGQTYVPDSNHSVYAKLVTQSPSTTGPWFNTFSLVAFGDEISGVPVGSKWTVPLPSSLRATGVPNISIQNGGPIKQGDVEMRVIEEASEPQWKMVAFDVSSAYADRSARVERRMLFVETNLLVLYDYIQTPTPVSVQWTYSVVGPVRLDPVWGHLIMERPHSTWTAHLPTKKGEHRNWELLPVSPQEKEASLSRFRIGNLSTQKEFHLLTVFAASPSGAHHNLALKLLESDSAIGLRIHRDGWPTLVAFRLHPTSESFSATLTGFGFKGSVGVDILSPKRSR